MSAKIQMFVLLTLIMLFCGTVVVVLDYHGIDSKMTYKVKLEK